MAGTPSDLFGYGSPSSQTPSSVQSAPNASGSLRIAASENRATSSWISDRAIAYLSFSSSFKLIPLLGYGGSHRVSYDQSFCRAPQGGGFLGEAYRMCANK